MVKTFTAVTIMVATATILTFSQEVAPKPATLEATRGKFISFPTEKMFIYDKNHKNQMYGIITGRDDKGVLFHRNNDPEKEIHIPWNFIDPTSVPLLKGEITFEEEAAAQKAKLAGLQKVVQEQIRKRDEADKAAREARNTPPKPKYEPLSEEERKALHKRYSNGATSAANLQKLFRENDPEFMRFLYTRKHGAYDGNDVTKWWGTRGPWRLVREMEEIKPIVDEKVSLRKEFEKLGVRSQKQVGYTCVVHSMHNVFQFLAAKHGAKPVPLQELLKFNHVGPIQNGGTDIRGTDAYQCLDVFKKINGKPPIVQELGTGFLNLEIEMLKDQLRKGHPCTISWMPNNEAHASVAVGFEVKDGKLTFEILDSNQLYNDNGYKTIDGAKINPVMSFWMESAK